MKQLDEIFNQLNASNNIIKDTEHLYDDNQLLRAFEDNQERAKQAIQALIEEEKTKARIDELENLQGSEMQLLENQTINRRLSDTVVKQGNRRWR